MHLPLPLPILAAASAFCGQEPWEALCTFILSQCNNIPRITGIVDRLCTLLGEPISFEQQTLYAFPSPEQLAAVHRRIWHLCAQATARRISSPPHRPSAPAQLIFPSCPAWTRTPARREIMQLRGVGRKVADCFLLFGLHKLDAFPVDTWMKKPPHITAAT